MEGIHRLCFSYFLFIYFSFYMPLFEASEAAPMRHTAYIVCFICLMKRLLFRSAHFVTHQTTLQTTWQLGVLLGRQSKRFVCYELSDYCGWWTLRATGYVDLLICCKSLISTGGGEVGGCHLMIQPPLLHHKRSLPSPPPAGNCAQAGEKMSPHFNTAWA